MQRTRRQILDILKRRGRATLEELAREVDLSPVTVRVHLSVLQRDDLVKVDEVRGKVGRPYFVYSLTEEAEDFFPKRYHVFANRLLGTMLTTLPSEQVAATMDQMSERWAAEKANRLEGKGFEEKVAEVARIRSEEGAIADWERVDGGYTLSQYNCPLLAVARVHPQACDAEAGYISKLLGVPVSRFQRIGDGDRVCAYTIPLPAN